MDRDALLKQIEDSYVRAVRLKDDSIPSGPFLISLNPAMKLRWLNNAVVNDDSQPITRADIQEMARVFESKDRLPRMEVFREIRSPLIELLQEEGFQVESEMPVMSCTVDKFKPQTADDVLVEMLSPDSDPKPFLQVVDIAFEHDEPITAERIENTRQSLRKGSQWSALARIEGEPAAVASLVVSDSVAELAGVGTLPQFRRRGAASTASTYLMHQFFGHGDLVWLSAGDDTSRLVYERLGFELVGVQVNISKER
jgi:predicted GNAT family acetyltransferase